MPLKNTMAQSALVAGSPQTFDSLTTLVGGVGGGGKERGLAGEEKELADLVNRLDKTSSRYDMEISA